MAQAVSHCVACDTNNPISWKCLDCDFSMCDTCKTSHERFPEDLKVVCIYQECKIHNKDISMYCSSCKVFVCVDCIAENHGKHDLDKIQNIVEEKWKEAEKVIQEAQENKDAIASELAYVKEIKTTLEENVANIYKAMKERDMNMKRTIEKQFQKCASKLEMQKTMTIETFLEYEQKLFQASSETDSGILTLQRCIENKDITTLMLKTSDVKENIRSLGVSCDKTIPVFTFMEGRNGIFGNIHISGQIPKTRSVTIRENKANDETHTPIKVQANKEDLHAPDSSICHHQSSSQRMFYTCGHKFCKECIHKRNCPVCGKHYDLVQNAYRCNLKIEFTKDNDVYKILFLPEFDNLLRQMSRVLYPSICNKWMTSLPTTSKGSLVLELLRIAFDRGLVFKRTHGYNVEVSSKELSKIIQPRMYNESLPEPASPEVLDSVILYLESQGVTEIDI